MKRLKIRYKIFLITGLFIFLVSCNKQPTADFTTDKDEYIAGETIKLINKSEHAETYLWTFPNGHVSAEENVEYKIPDTAFTRKQIFTLEVKSKKKDKKSTVSKYVNINEAMGQVVFWQAPTCSCGVTSVTLSGSTKQITNTHTATPTCGTSGTASFLFRVGTFTYTATDGTKNWNGNVTVNKDACTTLQLN